jgi:hypothetical protein
MSGHTTVLSESLGYLVLLFREDLQNETVSIGSSLSSVSDPVCLAMRPTTGQNSEKPTTSGFLQESKGVASESVEIMEVNASNKGQCKSQFADVDGFILPPSCQGR